MRQLLNTMFVTSEDVYLALDGENVLVKRGEEVVARRPLVGLSSIITFSYMGASPALMGKCARRGINLAFCTPRGRFLARASGEHNGNVLLRRQQYRVADDPASSCRIARTMVFGKVYNSRQVLERARRDHARSIGEDVTGASETLQGLLGQILEEISPESLRGLEGAAANAYFGAFAHLILQNRETFAWRGRSRRPPEDPINALLSFAYTMLANDCAAALESVGLDAYVGFQHRDRPGRRSLALDLMEEMRPWMADRFVLTLVNNRVMKRSDFVTQESGAVYLTDEARRRFLQEWQSKKTEVITHPYLGEKMPWGLAPYVQSLLLARTLRDDLEDYPPFLWK